MLTKKGRYEWLEKFLKLGYLNYYQTQISSMSYILDSTAEVFLPWLARLEKSNPEIFIPLLADLDFAEISRGLKMNNAHLESLFELSTTSLNDVYDFKKASFRFDSNHFFDSAYRLYYDFTPKSSIVTTCNSYDELN